MDSWGGMTSAIKIIVSRPKGPKPDLERPAEMAAAILTKVVSYEAEIIKN